MFLTVKQLLEVCTVKICYSIKIKSIALFNVKECKLSTLNCTSKIVLKLQHNGNSNILIKIKLLKLCYNKLYSYIFDFVTQFKGQFNFDLKIIFSCLRLFYSLNNSHINKFSQP